MEKTKTVEVDHDAMERDLMAMDDEALLRSIDEFVSCVRRHVWRHRMQIRTSIFAATIRTIERAMGEKFVRRVREPKRRWLFFGKKDNGDVVPVIRLDGGSPRTLDDLSKRFEVELFNPNLIDIAYLHSKRPLVPQGEKKTNPPAA